MRSPYTVEFQQTIVDFFKTTQSLQQAIFLAKQTFPNISPTTIKCWIDPDYKKDVIQRRKESTRQWREKNPEAYQAMVERSEARQMQKMHEDQKSKQERYKKTKAWRDANKERIKEYNRQRKPIRQAQRLEYERKKLKEDPAYRLKQNARSLIRHRLKKAFESVDRHYHKTSSTRDLLGCDDRQLLEHLRSRYKPGMTDQNYGEWHVDHIIPCSAFDLTDPDQQKKCFHFSNLQPLWALENMDKRDKLDWAQ